MRQRASSLPLDWHDTTRLGPLRLVQDVSGHLYDLPIGLPVCVFEWDIPGSFGMGTTIRVDMACAGSRAASCSVTDGSWGSPGPSPSSSTSPAPPARPLDSLVSAAATCTCPVSSLRPLVPPPFISHLGFVRSSSPSDSGSTSSTFRSPPRALRLIGRLWSSDGLAGSVIVVVSAGWLRDALRALALVFVGRFILRTVSSVLPSLDCPVHSPSSDALWGASGVVVVVSSSDIFTRLVSSSACARHSSLIPSQLSTSSSSSPTSHSG
ncbi:hypothetical protein OG21DRAFT_1491634 [Imleria badia]|nr:hypothetical protein OG21DRAFT_1491634 [Imleria badia]